MIIDASDNRGGFLGNDVPIHTFEPQMPNQHLGAPVINNFFGSDFGGGNTYKKPHSRRKQVAAVVIAIGVAAGIAKHDEIESRIDAWKDSRHERCMPSSAILNGDEFEACFKPSLMYDRGDGTIGALVTLKTIHHEATSSTAASPTSIVSNEVGSTAPAPTEQTGPFYYDIFSPLCSIRPEVANMELDNARKLIISNASNFSHDRVKIPTPLNPGDQAQLTAAMSKIIITSEYNSQKSGDGPAVISCP